jgi:hypothetical protein
MNPVVVSNAEWRAILTALTAALAPWAGAIVHLFKNNFTPSPASVLADYMEADFSGYAASAAIVWNPAAFLPDGTAVVTGDAKVFGTTSPATILNTVYGWYATNAGGTVLLFGRRFDNPIALNGPFQDIVVLPAYPAYVSQ